SEVLEKAKNKHIDVVSLAQKTPERTQFLSFTEPVVSSPWVVISRKDSNKFTDLSDYENSLVAMVKGYAIIEVSKQHFPKLNIQTVESSLDGLNAVATGKIDIFVENLTIASHLIQTHGLINLKIAADAGFGLQELSFGVRSDWPELTSILDKGLASITQDEKKNIVNKWLAISNIESIPNNDELSDPFWWSIGVGLITSLIVVLTIYLFISSHQERFILRLATYRFRLISSLFIGIFASSIFFIAWAALDYNKRNTIKKLANTLETVRDTTAEGLVLWLENKKEFLTHITREPRLIEITERILRVPITPEALKQSKALDDARYFFEQTDGIYKTNGFFIISPEYISIASRRDSNIGTINLIAQQRPDLLGRAFKGETVFVPPIYSDIAQSRNNADLQTPATMFIAAPIRNSDEKVIAVVTQRLDPAQQFSQMLRLGRIGETGETYAIDHKGLLISESRFTSQLRQSGLIAAEQNAILSLTTKEPLGNILQGHIPTKNRNELPLTKMAQSISNKEEQTNMSGYPDYRGVPVFGAWTWINSLGIGITTEIDVEEGLDTYYSERKTIIGALSISFLLFISTLMFTISIGTRSNRILKRSHNELEEKVVQRTADIQKAQKVEKDRVEVLERLMSGEALNSVMAFLIESVEQTNEGRIRCSILLLDRETQRLRHCAAPNLPDYFNQIVDGVEIGSSIGSCGAAAYNRQPVIITDVISHPNWKMFTDVSQQANIRACWSYPILSSNADVLGTLSCYSANSRVPTNEEQDIIRSTVYLASLAIEKTHSEAELVRARYN
ncbi:MAG: transporter substrate-binding domain-containing protein, partial [Gammaproteobacteria bacterium]|nr:transporter substrate-binding domain-containing protein [Gammaproteobacteria bacterium]